MSTERRLSDLRNLVSGLYTLGKPENIYERTLINQNFFSFKEQQLVRAILPLLNLHDMFLHKKK